MTPSSPKPWHYADWSPLGWLETVIKAVAFIIAFIALVNALTGGTAAAPVGWEWVIVILLGLLALGLTAAIVERYNQREIFAMGFVLVNVVAHWGMVYSLLTVPGPGGLFLLFVSLMLIGDVVKLVWLRVSGYSQVGVPASVMYGLTGFYAAGYLILVLLTLAGV